MTRQDLNKMLISAFAGLIGTVVFAIFFSRDFTQGGIEWLPWCIYYGLPFAFFAGICYGGLCLYQLLGNSIWDMKRIVKKYSKEICED